MSQTMFARDADYPHAEREPKQSENVNPGLLSPERVKRFQALKVPSLNWASSLFCDNATMAELGAEEFPLEGSRSALSRGQADRELCVQAAA